MIYIKKLKPTDFPEMPDMKWAVVATDGFLKTYDVCESFHTAIRYWLWHLGVPAKIAFKTWKGN